MADKRFIWHVGPIAIPQELPIQTDYIHNTGPIINFPDGKNE